MQIGVLGLNHKSAGLDLREKLARISLKRFGAECSFHGSLAYVLLTTCNRTEIYFSSSNLAATHSYFLNLLRKEIDEEFEHTIYSYFGPDCFFHLARVTAGLDSAILGETEIQGQVKVAYERAAHFRSLSRDLHYLFQKSLKIGKEMRTITHAPTLEERIFSLTQSLLGELSHKKILFVGISEVNLKIIKSLILSNLKNITLCNRTHSRALVLAQRYSLSLHPWERRHDVSEFDVLIYGTKSPTYLLRAKDIQPSLSQKVVIDLSVPRNCDPLISTLPHLKLLNIDEITSSQTPYPQATLMQLPEIAHAVDRQLSLFRKRETYLASKVI